jgi:hypothetical protein
VFDDLETPITYPFRQYFNAPPVDVKILSDKPGDFSIRTEASLPMMVVTHEIYHPQWKALVDRSPVKAARVNAVFLGVAVKPGAHIVEFRYSGLPTRLL